MIHGKGEVQTGEKIDHTFKVEDISITIINNGHYPSSLVDEIQTKVEKSTKTVIDVTNGKITPDKQVTITLTPSKEDMKVLPTYNSSVIVDPDIQWLDQYNFEEMMLHSIFPTGKNVVPFTTIGLGQYLFYAPQKGEIYDSNEMWILHKNEQKTLEFESLLSYDLFTNIVLNEHGPYRENPKPEAHYWKLASFAHFLIEEYGMDKFIDLYNAQNLNTDSERVYDKSFKELQAEWEQTILELEEHFTPRVRQDLHYQYQYLYE